MSMMLEIKSKSDKRLIVEGVINDRRAMMLVDTGATVGLFSKEEHCETPLLLGRTMIYQFYVADISDVVSSIKRQTGIEIQGIISLPQCKVANMEIDTDDNLIKIGAK